MDEQNQDNKIGDDKSQLKIRPLRTYEEDVTTFIKRGQVSTAKIVLAEEKRKSQQLKVESAVKAEKITGKTLKLSLFLILGGIFVVFGIFFYKQFFNKVKNEIARVELRDILMDKKEKKEIFVNDKLNSEVKKEFISYIKNPPQLNFSEIAEVKLIRKSNVRQPNDKIIEQKEKVSVSDLFQFLDFKPEGQLIRAFEDNYLAGVIGTNSGTYPFIIIKTREFQNVFSGMIVWERTMFREVNDIFYQTLPVDDFIPKPPDFKDIVISNKDTRAILDENGDVQFYYSFANNNHLLIASKIEVLSEIQKKLNLQNIVR